MGHGAENRRQRKEEGYSPVGAAFQPRRHYFSELNGLKDLNGFNDFDDFNEFSNRLLTTN